ncbi:hypothetical protein CLOM_g3761 [Closterium sp. NIES-68]|nr:hypothetical protein CLOM_g3761 [Closterium sp. NIES-68]
MESRSSGAGKGSENGLLWIWQQQYIPQQEQQKGKRSRVQNRIAAENSQQRRGGPFVDLTNTAILEFNEQGRSAAAESDGIRNNGKAASDCVDSIHLGNGDSPGRMHGGGQAGGGKPMRKYVKSGRNRWASTGEHEVVDLDTPESVTVKVLGRGNALLREAGGCPLACTLNFAPANCERKISCGLVNLIDLEENDD